MLRWLMRNRLNAFERKYGYDVSYVREILAADPRAVFALMNASRMGKYHKDIPRDAYWATGIIGSMTEDCGPCTQLGVTMALEAGANPAVLAAVIRGDDAALPDDARLAVQFARAALAHAPEADALREAIIARWGMRAVISIAYAIAAARIFPTIKYALGHGKTCQRIRIEGQDLAVARSAA